MKSQQDKFKLQQLQKNLKTRNFKFSALYVQQILQILQLKLKTQKLFQSFIQSFINLYLAYHSCQQQIEFSITPLFNKIISMPTELMQDNIPDWHLYYRNVKTFAQDARARKFHLLLKLVEYKWKDEIVQSKKKLWSLFKKPVDKEFYSVSTPILIAHYYYSVYRGLYFDQEFSIQPIYEILDYLYHKKRAVFTQIILKFMTSICEVPRHFESFMVASINLMTNTEGALALIDLFIANTNIKAKIINIENPFWSNKKQMNMRMLLKIPNHDRCSAIKSITMVFTKLLLKYIEDQPSFDQIVTKMQQYFSDLQLFILCFNHICVFLISSNLIPKSPVQNNSEEMIEKYSQNMGVLLFVCIAYSNVKGLADELGKLLKGESLNKIFLLLVDFGFEKMLEEGREEKTIDALLMVYKKFKHQGLENVAIRKLYWICRCVPKEKKEESIKKLIEVVKELNLENLNERLFLRKIEFMHQQLLVCYLKDSITLKTIKKIVKMFFDSDTLMLMFLNMLMKIMLFLPKQILRQEKKRLRKYRRSVPDIFLSTLRMSIRGRAPSTPSRKMKTIQDHPYLQKAVDLIESLAQYGEVMKRIFRFHIDRPSEIMTEREILGNRFLMRFIFVGRIIGAMRTVIGVVSESESVVKEKAMESMFPEIESLEARKVYLKYLQTKDLVEFRTEAKKCSRKDRREMLEDE